MLHLLIFSYEVHKLVGDGSSQKAVLFRHLLTSCSAVGDGVYNIIAPQNVQM